MHNTDGFADVIPYYERVIQAFTLAPAYCGTPNTSLTLLVNALVNMELTGQTCSSQQHLFYLDSCAQAFLRCFVDEICRTCMDALFHRENTITKHDALKSSACNAIVGYDDDDIVPNLIDTCTLFPKCTYYKYLCNMSSECASCLDVFNGGNGAGAARQCPAASTSGELLDSAMLNGHSRCADSTATACDFALQRCADAADCYNCLTAMSSDGSAEGVIRDWSSPSCSKLAASTLGSDMLYMQSVITLCPNFGNCQKAVSVCLLYETSGAPQNCLSCINETFMLGNTSADDDAKFDCIEGYNQDFDLVNSCKPSCSNLVETINAVVLATAVVGGVSATICITVAFTILAHGRDLVSMRDRIVIGLMLTNAVYSTANAIPISALRTGALTCGRLALSFDAIRIGRALWFCGKYGLVSFELMIIGTSIRALYYGLSAVPHRTEVLLHTLCYLVALGAFVSFYILCDQINAAGYNTETESVAFTNEYDHANPGDDLDDYNPYADASSKFLNQHDEYDELIRMMLITWDVFVAAAMCLWIMLRLMHVHVLRSLRVEAAMMARAQENDEWAETRRSAWAARRELLDLRRQSFAEVYGPLEPYIAVFVLFATPAFVMSTSYCQNHSAGTHSVTGFRNYEYAPGSVGRANTESFTFGTCDVWCEFALSFRSLGTVFVFLLPRARRAEFVSVCATGRKLWARVVGSIRTALARNEAAAADHEMIELADAQHTDSVDQGTAIKSWELHESDLVKVRRLDSGAFGEVWEGRLKSDGRRVAIKVLFAGVVDEEGDVIDVNADEDFRKECDVLQRIDNPHLLKFIGCGSAKGGNGFIVTELLGVSLERALHNDKCDLPWKRRVSFGLQVALGMEHLHKLNMLHRDLKSANVLLDENLELAKVCDFGLSRMVRPTLQHIVHSPFTGVTHHLPVASAVALGSYGTPTTPLSITDVSVSILDAHGTMTKATGTMLWMSPEVFRGDQNYGRAADVYSFGIVLWELATRETPWRDLPSAQECSFLVRLNQALQTGRRPTIPSAITTTHPEFVAVMKDCWAGDPVDRPTFSVAAARLAACVRDCDAM